jgi:signal transduction histidine kinase/DNA-binding response OmpR family regulator
VSQELEERVNILLVDDRADNLLALKSVLAPLKENLVAANSGREALKALLDQDFAVILMDVMMPDMDGFETARLIRKRDKSRLVPIIFITANLTEESNAFQGYAAGAVDYIIKPFPPEILRSKVQIFIELFKKTEQVRKQAELIRNIEQREYENRLNEAREKMEAEAERVLSEQKIAQAVVQHAPIGIVRLDRYLAISEANPTFCKMFNFDAERNHGRPVLEALPWLPANLAEAMARGEAGQVGELKINLLDSHPLPKNEKSWDLFVWPIKDRKNHVVNTILAAADATERVMLEEQRKDFVGTLAHDLQTPVIASDRALELLLTRLRGLLEPELEKLISMLKANNQHLLHMIQSLLDVYHYEAGARALYFDDVELKSLVTTCVEELMPLANEQGLKINYEKVDANIRARADRTALRRVITNLLDNAIKFSHRGGTITVAASKQAKEVSFTVEDEGVGIEDKDRPHLFERFWHGSLDRRKSFKGSSGLGLYLCRQIIEAHGGRIDCESERGKWTRFVVSLPVLKSEAAKAKTTPTDSVPVGAV